VTNILQKALFIMDISSYLNIAKHITCNRLGLSHYPSYCTFIYTWKCNLRCGMCDIWKRPTDNNELNVDQITEMFYKLRFLKFIRITGGEPFLRNDIIEVIESIVNTVNPAILHLTTNGYFTDRTLDLLDRVAGKYLHLKVSIDGPEVIHDTIRGVKGSYKKAIETLEKSARLQKIKKFHLGVNYTIQRENCDIKYLNELSSFCKGLGVDFHSYFAYEPPPLYAAQQSVGLETAYRSFENKKNNLVELLNLLPKYTFSSARADSYKERYYIKGFKNRIINGINRPNPRCVELGSHIRLLPNGDITVCLYKPDVVGNVLHSDFDHLWFHNNLIKESRKEVRSCHGCWAGCEIGPNAIFTGDIVRVMP